MHILVYISGNLAGVIAGALIGLAAVLAMIPVVPLVIGIKRGTVKWKGKLYIYIEHKVMVIMLY